MAVWRRKLIKKAAKKTWREFRSPTKFTGRIQRPKRPGIKAKGYRWVSRRLGRKGVTKIPVRIYGGTSFHPFNLIPKGQIKGNPYSKSWWLPKKKKSQRGPGSAIKRTGRPKSRKTMRARSAPKPKMVRYRKGGCPPGYRYDPRRKMCIQNKYK